MFFVGWISFISIDISLVKQLKFFNSGNKISSNLHFIFENYHLTRGALISKSNLVHWFPNQTYSTNKQNSFCNVARSKLKWKPRSTKFLYLARDRIIVKRREVLLNLRDTIGGYTRGGRITTMISDWNDSCCILCWPKNQRNIFSYCRPAKCRRYKITKHK
jgi:hypothetical protein